MFIYQQNINSNHRIVWPGGNSTMLHYEVKDPSGKWHEMGVRSFMNGMPAGMSEMHAAMVDYLDYCLTMEHDNLAATI